jgi:signal transduction histidine kinase
LVVLLLLLFGMGGSAYVSWRATQAAFEERRTTNESLLHLEQALSFMKDAETGQRGFLLTRDPSYLQPYLDGRRNFQAEYDSVGACLPDNRAIAAILGRLRPLVAGKLEELAETIRAARQVPVGRGFAEVRLGRGKQFMDAIRELHDQLGALITAQARAADAQALGSARRTLVEVALLTGIAFAGIALFMVRAARFENSLMERSILLESEVQQRSEAELGILRLNRELLASNQELEAFAYSVAHDLRAPLRHVDGFAQLVRNGLQAGASARTLHQLDVIQDSAQRMGRLIDDLLKYSRLGRSELHKIPVPLATLLAQVRLDLAEEETGRSIEWHLSPLPTVLADPTLLRLAVQNLLGNALKFTRQRSPAIIEVGCQPEKGITLFVKDNGTGFDMRFADKLFKPFQRLHQQEDFEGTGIGLATVGRVAARHGGRAWAEGVPGQGATFYFSIPEEG